MKIIFTPEPIPELTITGGQLAALGFTTDAPIRLMLRDNTLSVTTVTDEAGWKELCEASQQCQDLGADWVRENGEVITGGSWLTEFGITDAGQIEIAAAADVLRLQRR